MLVLLTLVLVAAVTAAIGVGLARATTSVADGRRLGGVVALVLAGWLAVTAAAAASGLLADFDARPPRMFFVLAGALVLFTALVRHPTVARAIDAMPTAWPIAIQTMRVPIELGLYALFASGKLPEHLTFEGRNFDVLVGITAPFAALAASRGWLGRRGLVAWNVASLGLLANIVGMAITTMPGPLHLPWSGPSNVVIAEVPYVWLPAFLVPVALFGHVVSLRQLHRDRSAVVSAYP